MVRDIFDQPSATFESNTFSTPKNKVGRVCVQRRQAERSKTLTGSAKKVNGISHGDSRSIKPPKKKSFSYNLG